MASERVNFEKRFNSAVKEVLVLTQDGMGAGKAGKDVLWDVRMQLLAYIDVQTDQLIRENSSLTWQLTEEECRTKEKIFDLEREHIYRLKVRESLPCLNEYTGEQIGRGAYLMVVEVMERDAGDSRLEEILKEYRKPVTMQAVGCSKLQLDKSLGMFDGDCQWNGEECMVHLDVDERGAETALDAEATLAKLLSESTAWDEKARAFAALKLVDTANDWLTDEDENAPEITEEDFAARLSISELCVSTDGDFELFYDDDDMFWGHVIIVSGNIEDGLDDATIAG